MNTQLNTTRVDNTVANLQAELKKAEEHRAKIVKSAEHYLGVVEAILKRRHIKIESNQLYFNDMTTKYERGLLNIRFKEVVSDKRAKALEKAVRDAGVPCPICSFTADITVTLYDETFIE